MEHTTTPSDVSVFIGYDEMRRSISSQRGRGVDMIGVSKIRAD
jgi:hypothetical protein